MFQYLKKLRDEHHFNPKKILDIGAWNGIWTKEVKTIWPEAKFTCVEAGQKHEKHLKLLTDDYHIAVLGDVNKQVKFYLREIQKGDRTKITYTKGSTVFGVYKDYDLRQMQTLGNLVGEDAKYDLIKQDVQGAEIMIMNGAPEIFKRATYVIQEVNLFPSEQFKDMPHESQMDDYMNNLGFTDSERIADHDGRDQIDKIYFNARK
jgi:FkbM family methyltransferase